jgi:hypothetical protein
MDRVMLQVYRRGRRFRLCLGIRGPSGDHLDRACSARSDSMDVNESAKRFHRIYQDECKEHARSIIDFWACCRRQPLSVGMTNVPACMYRSVYRLGRISRISIV